MKKLKCWKKYGTEKFGNSFKNNKGDVVDVLVTYKWKPVSVFLTKKDPSKVRQGIQYGTKNLYSGSKGKAYSFAEKFMEEHDSC